MALTQAMVEAVRRMATQDLDELSGLVRHEKSTRKRAQFYPGQQVTFEHRGVRWIGKITGVNDKTASVLTSSPQKVKYRVGWDCLTPYEPAVAPAQA